MAVGQAAAGATKAAAGVMPSIDPLGIFGVFAMIAPVAMFFAAQSGFPPEEILHLALATSMATIVFTSFSSLRAHHRHGAVLWEVVVRITPGILLGTFLGSLLAARISARPLALFFAFVVSIVALQMLLDLKPKGTRELPGTAGIVSTGMVIGAISTLAAIAGGAFTVSFLTWCNVKIQKAIGTSAAVGFPLSIGGTLGYIHNGWGHAGLPDWSLGFVYLPALLWMVPASMLMAPVGARLTHRLPVQLLRRIFACFLVFMALRMVWKVYS